MELFEERRVSGRATMLMVFAWRRKASGGFWLVNAFRLKNEELIECVWVGFVLYRPWKKGGFSSWVLDLSIPKKPKLVWVGFEYFFPAYLKLILRRQGRWLCWCAFQIWGELHKVRLGFMILHSFMTHVLRDSIFSVLPFINYIRCMRMACRKLIEKCRLIDKIWRRIIEISCYLRLVFDYMCLIRFFFNSNKNSKWLLSQS